MGRAKETYGKKETRDKKAKKRKEKENKKIKRKELGKQNLDDMIAYVDENGMISATPPDLLKKEEVDAGSIEIGIPKKELRQDVKLYQGMVSKFDELKKYGFIVDKQTKDSIFVHMNDCLEPIKTGDKVEFNLEKGLKGFQAKNVKLKK